MQAGKVNKMRMSVEGQMMLTLENYIPVETATEETDKTFSEVVFDFDSLFEGQLAEENMKSNNSMAILGDSLSVLKKNERQVCSAYFCRCPLQHR